MAAPKKKPTKAKKKGGIGFKRLLIGSLVTALLGVIVGIVGYLLIILRGQTLYTEYKDKMVMSEASVVYDQSDKEVTTLYKENRELVEYKDIPKLLADAFIATEDRRYYEHNGIDFVSIGRALVKDVLNRSAVEGGSTITQQLAKNMFLTSDKTAFRKATEVSIALALENKLSKDQIITMYLNRIYFGNRAWGIEAASKTYFGVSDLSQLKVWQMATLAAIPKAPSTYNPLDNPDKSKERRAVVLKLMNDQGYITDQERKEAEAVDYTPPKGTKTDYSTFMDYVIKEAQDRYNIEEDKLLRGGYSIYTTMNTDAQKIVEQTYDDPKYFQKDASDGVKIQSAMAIVDHRNGGIVAMIGGRDYASKGLNRAIVAARQPGSSFKPIIDYAPALETGKWNPYSMLEDKEQSYNGYTPHNWDNTYRGEVNMFDALKQSMNQPAVWMLSQIGVKYATSFASKLGFKFDPVKDNNLAIALGGITNGASPLQMAQAYGAFAEGGYMYTSHSIDKIVDSAGKEVAPKDKVDKPVKVMSPKTAYYMTKLLESVVQPGGLGIAANLGDRPTAGKTGTTQLDLPGLERYNRDAWFVGYTPEWSAAVWEGFDITDSKHFVTIGSGSTATLFKDVVGKALAKAPIVDFKKPDGVPELGEAPQAIADLAGNYVKESKQIKLTWSAAGDGVTYQVFRKGTKDAEFQKLLEVKDSTSLTDLNVMPGETYQYYVVVFNPETNAASDNSNVVEVKAGDASPSPSASSSPPPSPGISGSPAPLPPGGKPGASPGLSPTPASPTPTTGAKKPTPAPSPSGKPAATATNSPLSLPVVQQGTGSAQP